MDTHWSLAGGKSYKYYSRLPYNEHGYNDNSAITSTFPKSRSVCAHLYGSVFVYNERGYNENLVLTSILADPHTKKDIVLDPFITSTFPNKRALRPRHYQKPTLDLESRARCFMSPILMGRRAFTNALCGFPLCVRRSSVAPHRERHWPRYTRPRLNSTVF